MAYRCLALAAEAAVMAALAATALFRHPDGFWPTLAALAGVWLATALFEHAPEDFV